MPILSYSPSNRRGGLGALSVRLALGISLAVGYADTALAEPATADGARKLTEVFQGYVGAEPFAKGFLAIAPRGDGYDVTVSFDSSKVAVPDSDGVLVLKPYVLHLTPSPNGTWAVSKEAGPIALNWHATDPGNKQKFDLKLADCTSQGVFDPKLKVFTTLSSKCGSGALAVRAPDGDVDVTTGELASQSTGKTGASGGVDLQLDLQMATLHGTFIDRKPAGEPTPFTFQLGKAQQAIAVSGARLAEISDLVAFARQVAPMARSAVPQDELKAKLRAALPLWEDIATSISLDDGTVGAGPIVAKIAHVEEKQALSGIVKDARYGDTLSYSGLELPAVIVPDWARSLVPTQASYETKLSFSGLDGMADALIRGLDVTQDPPLSKMAGVALVTRFFNGSPRYDLGVAATAPAYTVKGQGQASINPEPQAGIGISATGFDAVVDALNKSNDDDVQKALMGLAFVKGLAKGGPDGQLVWNVSYDMITNSIVVNDQNFKLPDPQ